MILNIRIFKDNGVLIIFEVTNILDLFFHKSQMDHMCKLHSKCLKEDKSLEACNNAECSNVIHQGYFKKLVVTFGENEREGHCFAVSSVSSTTKEALAVATSKKPKEECHGMLMVLHLKSTPWQ